MLDFKEIPAAHEATGLQDSFELFAREFFAFLGYAIEVDPSRGADGGADIILTERRIGVGGETVVRWLVSCKHKAHSQKSVSPDDDSNIRDRVDRNKCKGFIGFYSTLASSGLSGLLEGLKDKIEYQLFDRDKIEGKLINSAKGLELAGRYFPISLSKWKTENPTPAQIFSTTPSLQCNVCHRELFEQEDKGIITIWQNVKDYKSDTPKHTAHVSWVCRGYCDDIFTSRMRKKNKNLVDGWEDISDVLMPTIYIKWVMTTLNELKSGETYSEEAFDSLKTFLLHTFPYVSRHLTEKEKERIRTLGLIPSFLGGLGY